MGPMVYVVFRLQQHHGDWNRFLTEAIKKVVTTAPPPPTSVAPPMSKQRSTPTVAIDGSYSPLARFMTASDSCKCSACNSNPQKLNTGHRCVIPRPTSRGNNAKPKAPESSSLMFGASSGTSATALTFSFEVPSKSDVEEKKRVSPPSATVTTPSSSLVNGFSPEAAGAKSSFSFGVSAPQEVSKPVASSGFGVSPKIVERKKPEAHNISLTEHELETVQGVRKNAYLLHLINLFEDRFFRVPIMMY